MIAVGSGRRPRGGPEGWAGVDEKLPSQRRQASPFHADAAVSAKMERMERDVACAGNAARLLGGVDSLDEGVLGDEAVEHAAGLRGTWDSALRSLGSDLPGPRSHLRYRPAERRPPSALFPKDHSVEGKTGREERGAPGSRDRRLYNHSVKRY